MSKTTLASIGIACAAVAFAPGAPRAGADHPICMEHVCSFYSPSHMISCEIDYQRDPAMPDSTYCQIGSLQPAPQSVHMDPDGTYSVCTGESCLGNPGLGQGTLAYGQTAGLGPFTCRSEVSGVTCTVTSGPGFTISSAGITPVG
jgi:hypothetical protein